MTTPLATPPTHADPLRTRDRDPGRRAERWLRMVLRLNAAFSIVTGLTGLVAGGPVADVLDVDQVWLVRLIGGGLLAFAAVVLLVAASDVDTLVTWSTEISMADIGWVLGTVVVLALGWLSTTGAIVMAIIALVVADFAVLQLLTRRRLVAATSGPPERSR